MLDVAVNPVSNCEDLPCDIRFEARVLGADPSSVQFDWSGCGAGSEPIVVCHVTRQEGIIATVTVTSKVTGERATASATAAARMVNVFYGTDRRPARQRDSGRIYFTGEMNTDSEQPLSLGVAAVAIPPGHERGAIERPHIWKFQLTEDTTRHVVILEETERTADAFFADLHHRVDSSEAKRAFVFVHGFNVDFADALRDTAQLAWDVKFRGVPILYSWPSLGSPSPAAYGADYDAAHQARYHFARFLRDVKQRSGAEDLYLIAHSMGAWAVLNGLEAFDALPSVSTTASPAPNPNALQLKELVFAAPDVDQKDFAAEAPRWKRHANRVTMYAASGDKALWTSRGFRDGRPRAGESGDYLLVVPDVETIDASAVVNENTNVLDHSYVANTISALDDVSAVLKSEPVRSRPGLEARHHGPHSYWRIVPSGLPLWFIRDLEYVFAILAGVLVCLLLWNYVLRPLLLAFLEAYLRRRLGFWP